MTQDLEEESGTALVASTQNEMVRQMSQHFMPLLQTLKDEQSASLAQKLFDEYQDILLKQTEELRLTSQMSSGRSPSDELHLAYLFASPLMGKIKGKMSVLMLLDLLTEYEGLVEGVKEIQKDVRVRARVGTRGRILNFALWIT